MKSAICTLYEGHYHYGVAALSNSLYKNGFRGPMYVGYRGDLPFWAKKAKENKNIEWDGVRTLTIDEGFEIHFLPLTIDYHLSNYKPVFMLQLLDGIAKNVNGLFYYDPDIVIKCRWSFYENWISHGVALVHEIISNDMKPNHPLRREWEKVISKSGKSVKRELHSYINSGFCGVTIENKPFLKDWIEIIETGVKYFNYSTHQFSLTDYRGYVFFAQDQDAFNIAAMCFEGSLSEMGPEAMDFIHGGFTMSHAVGTPKPWKKQFLLSAFKGNPPSLAEKAYWQNVEMPIKLYTYNQKISLKIASAIGRFYRKY